MSDERVQDLRRRVEQGEPGARGKLIRELVRIGLLPLDHLYLALYVGDPDARAAFKDRWYSTSVASGESWTQRVRGPEGDLLAIPQELDVWLTGFVAWETEVSVRVGLAVLRWAGEEAPALDLLEEWLVCPCAEHMRRCAEVIEYLPAAWGLVRLAAGRLEHGVEWIVHAYSIDPPGFRGAILAEVAPWALGERDPVKQRVEGRK